MTNSQTGKSTVRSLLPCFCCITDRTANREQRFSLPPLRMLT
jgi:hypothetical protein